MKVAFGTVCYPAALKFIDDFAGSIVEQDCSDFSLIIVCDGLSADDEERVLSSLPNAVLIDGNAGASVSGLRLQLISETKAQGYDYLVFGDFDDISSSNRVRNTIRTLDLSRADFAYNAIRTFTGEQFFSVGIPGSTCHIRDIAQSNYLGLCNTALNLHSRSLSSMMDHIPDRCPDVFDWYLFSRILISEGWGVDVPGAFTKYRIYSGNIAGNQVLSDDQVCKEIRVKREHYKALRNLNPLMRDLFGAYAADGNRRISIAASNTNYWWSTTRVEEKVNVQL
jgi:hypothetical protein